MTMQLTNFSPPRSWGARGIDGPIRAIVNGTVEPLEGEAGSRVTIELDPAARDPERARGTRMGELVHDDRPDEAQLLADDGEDEVGVGEGQEPPLGAAGAEPAADSVFNNAPAAPGQVISMIEQVTGVKEQVRRDFGFDPDFDHGQIVQGDDPGD